jgi:SAM-dependent methyltransferase
MVDWGAGKYETAAAELEPVANAVVERAGISAGDDVVDVACGTGNAALIAAARGARVVGVDGTVRLLEVARERSLRVVGSRGRRVRRCRGGPRPQPHDAGRTADPGRLAEAYVAGGQEHPMAVAMRPLVERAGAEQELREAMTAVLRDANEDPDALLVHSPYVVHEFRVITP